MRIGLIGAGNMARALARGWGEPVLCTDAGSGRAAALVAELGGEVAASNAELARGCDLVVLCHKPAQLETVAREIAAPAPAVASVIAGVTPEALQAVYPGVPVFALVPNTPVEVRQGLILYTPTREVDGDLERRVLERFGRVGRVVRVEPAKLWAATGTTACGPAYVALVVEAQVDAAVRQGIPAAFAAELVSGTVAGSARLIAHRGHDTLAVRREVTSPGGITARGLDALERRGVRAAFQDALEAVLHGGRT